MASSADERVSLMEEPSPQGHDRAHESTKQLTTRNVHGLLSQANTHRTQILRKAIANEPATHVIDTVNREDSNIIVLCGLGLLNLYLMAMSSHGWFDDRDTHATRWAQLMETTRFIDWHQLPETSSLPVICAVVPIVVGVVSAIVVPWGLYTRNARAITLFACAMLLTTAVSIMGIVLPSTSASIGGDMLESLSSHSLPFANINRPDAFIVAIWGWMLNLWSWPLLLFSLTALPERWAAPHY